MVILSLIKFDSLLVRLELAIITDNIDAQRHSYWHGAIIDRTENVSIVCLQLLTIIFHLYFGTEDSRVSSFVAIIIVFENMIVSENLKILQFSEICNYWRRKEQL